MTLDWSPLRAELALWRAAGLSLPVWWRDDDAIAVTPQLDQLAHLASDLGLPVHLAVIPAHAEQALATYVASAPLLIPTIHGWAHDNRAPEGQKKAEFGHERTSAGAELTRALSHMQGLFGTGLVPAFVAPWNRLHPGVLPLLAQAGYTAVSTFTPRRTSHPVPGLLCVNTHIDPIDWRGTRGLLPPDQIITETVNRLRARRENHEDRTEPLGYLTHHLVHSPDIWSFSRAFLTELLAAGAHCLTLTQALEEAE